MTRNSWEKKNTVAYSIPDGSPRKKKFDTPGIQYADSSGIREKNQFWLLSNGEKNLILDLLGLFIKTNSKNDLF